MTEVEPRERQRLGAFGIAALSLGVMVSNTVWPFTFGVLAPVLLEELSLTPAMFGITYAVYYASAAIGSSCAVKESGRMPSEPSESSTERLPRASASSSAGSSAVTPPKSMAAESSNQSMPLVTFQATLPAGR